MSAQVLFSDGLYSFWQAWAIDYGHPITFRVPEGRTPYDRIVDGKICGKRIDPTTIKEAGMEHVIPWMVTHGGTFLKDGYPLDVKEWPPRFEWPPEYEDDHELIAELIGDLYEIFFALATGISYEMHPNPELATPRPQSEGAYAAQR